MKIQRMKEKKKSFFHKKLTCFFAFWPLLFWYHHRWSYGKIPPSLSFPYVSLPYPEAVYPFLMLSIFLFRSFKKKYKKKNNLRACAIVYDSSCFFGEEELAVSWYVLRSSRAARLRHLRGFFPSFYQTVCTRAACLRKWVWTSFSLP